jgi:hypothetical protein
VSLDTQRDVLTSTTVRAVVKKPMVKRTVYVPPKLWDDAKDLADSDPEGINISIVVRRLLEGYVKKEGGKR